MISTPRTVPDELVTTPVVGRLHAASVLADADLHVADAVARLTGTADPDVLLAVALAVRAPRLGHVCLDLPRLRDVGLATEAGERVVVDLPDLDGWLAALAASPAVRTPERPDLPTPLVLDGHRLYLDRYWRYEARLVTRLHRLADTTPADRDGHAVATALDQLFPDPADAVQRRAAELAATRALTVITGGPGTGKTTTVVRLLACLWLTARDGAPPRAVLAAPTGKAAARMSQAVRDTVASLPLDTELRAALEQLPALTVHRLLGYRPDAPTRFRHDATNPVPYDVVVLDEASMASLPLMTKLGDALADGARLVLVGDRDQLASVDAGAVLSDICGPDGDATSDGPAAGVAAGEGALARGDTSGGSAPTPPIARGLVRLTRFHRFGPDSGIGAVARAIRHLEDPPAVSQTSELLALLRGERTEPGGPSRYDDVALLPPAATPDVPLPPDVLGEVVASYAGAVRAAQQGADPTEILRAFEGTRVLAALRHGPQGVVTLDRAIAVALAHTVPDFDADARFPLGRPVMVTRNDHRAGLYNGDVGVVVDDPADPERRRVAFPAPGGQVRLVAPARLPETESVFAMSIHKSQGSQFQRVVVVLPRVDVPLLTRELIYTGITRAARHVTVVADDTVLTAALGRRVQRASGLTERLWHPASSPTDVGA